jgi:hypothetical protein
MIFTQSRRAQRKLPTQAADDPKPAVEFNAVPLAVVKADRFDGAELRE